jgi:hypothetical protein
MARRPGPVGERFWPKVRKTDECWIWEGSKTKGGYGTFLLNGKRTSASRAAWELENGPLDPLLVVHQKCGNRSCVRLEHFVIKSKFLKSPATPFKRGTDNIQSKLQEHQVRRIRELHEKGMSIYSLAKKYKVAQTTIRCLVREITWKHII